MATTEPRKSSPTGAWREQLYEATPERPGELFSTISGIETEPLYTSESVDVDYERGRLLTSGIDGKLKLWEMAGMRAVTAPKANAVTLEFKARYGVIDPQIEMVVSIAGDR